MYSDMETFPGMVGGGGGGEGGIIIFSFKSRLLFFISLNTLLIFTQKSIPRGFTLGYEDFQAIVHTRVNSSRST